MIKNKKIVITGGASGIGSDLVRLLADNNKLVVCDLNVDEILDHENVSKIKCDVSRQEDLDDLIEKSFEVLKDIDIFISNAGFGYYEKLTNADYKKINYIFKTNVYASIYILLKIKEIKKDKPFQFVMTASGMSFNALPGYALYSSTKFALRGFANAYRYELNKGQKLQLVYPIATYTKFFDKFKTKHMPWPRQKSEVVARKIISGIEKKSDHIFPSKIFMCIFLLDRIIPVLKIYNFIEYMFFKRSFK